MLKATIGAPGSPPLAAPSFPEEGQGASADDFTGDGAAAITPAVPSGLDVTLSNTEQAYVDLSTLSAGTTYRMEASVASIGAGGVVQIAVLEFASIGAVAMSTAGPHSFEFEPTGAENLRLQVASNGIPAQLEYVRIVTV